MKIYIDGVLSREDYVDNKVSRGLYTRKLIRSTKLAKKMYRGRIFADKDGMLDIRTPIESTYKVAISGYYSVNGCLLQLNEGSVVKVEYADHMNIRRIG